MELNTIREWFRNALPKLDLKTGEAPSETSELVASSGYQSSKGSIAAESKYQISQNQKQLKAELKNPDPKVLEKLSQVNKKRASKGLAPVNLAAVSERLEAIYQDASLSDKQKKEKIDELRKELGLSKGEMKSLFTKRIEKAYKNAEKRLATFEKAKSEQLQAELKQAEATYGKESAQAKSVQTKIDNLKSSLEPERSKLKSHANFFGSIYPGFFSKLGGFFKKVGQGFAKAIGAIALAVRYIPGLGPMVSSALRSVQSLVQGKLKDFGKNLLGTALSAAKNFLHAIPGVGTIASYAVTGIEALVNAARSAKQP